MVHQQTVGEDDGLRTTAGLFVEELYAVDLDCGHYVFVPSVAREPCSLQNFPLRITLFQVYPQYNRSGRVLSLRSRRYSMDNKAIANIFYETADLMKVASADPFRIRSYERAAEALEGWPQQVSGMEEKALLEIPGIGKSMAANIREVATTGKMSMHEEMLKKFRPSMLQLLKVSGLG